jgi:hypothetical protein
LFGWVTKAEQDFFGAIFFRVQDGDGFAEGFHAEVFGALGTIDAIHERSEVEEFCAGVHEVEVENLLACHTVSNGMIFAQNGLFGNWLWLNGNCGAAANGDSPSANRAREHAQCLSALIVDEPAAGSNGEKPKGGV